jgi:hypothetical protein
MNKIYIVNNDNDFEIELNFKDNTFEHNNFLCKFEFISKDKIMIYMDNKEEIYYTDDSYIYYTNNELKNIVSKLFLIHYEWYDQIILNHKKKTLIRFKCSKQFGTFFYEDIKLIIDWDRWGKEIFVKYDNYTYIKEEYINVDTLYVNKRIPIHIFIHVCMIENWESIFNDQINTIKKSGLYNKCEKIHIGLLGNSKNISLEIFNDDKFNILYIDCRINIYEINTINFIKYFCSNIDEEVYILYIHTKGVRKAGNEEVTISWRKMMEYFLIENYIYCINNLNIYDTIGNNVVNLFCHNMDEISINKNHTYHYSGNFWWSKKSYIDKLKYLDLDLSKTSINTRYKAENWILSEYPNANVGFIFQDDTNTHPYHRYVFEYYKNINIFIKKLY